MTIEMFNAQMFIMGYTRTVGTEYIWMYKAPLGTRLPTLGVDKNLLADTNIHLIPTGSTLEFAIKVLIEISAGIISTDPKVSKLI